MSNKVLNFDKFMSEKKKERIAVTVFGKEYSVPCEIPAIVTVMMARAEFSMSERDNTVMVMKAADSLFGEESVNAMCADGLSTKDLAALVQQIFQKINTGDDDEENDEQELTDEDSRTAAKGAKSSKK